MITYRIAYDGLVSQCYVPTNIHERPRAYVLLPGLPMSFTVTPFIRHLVDAGNFVFYPFYSGTYDSDGSFTGESAVADGLRFGAMARQTELEELYFHARIALPPQMDVVFIGNSFSAVVALHAQAACDKLILISPVLLYDQTDITRVRHDFDFRGQMDHLRGLLRDGHPFTYRAGDASALRDFLYGNSATSATDGIRAKLREIAIPTLVVHGRKDTSVPIELTEAMLAEAANEHVRYLAVDDAGHSLTSYPEAALDEIAAF